MIIISGKTCSGKDRTVNYLVDNFNYKKIITYTTRPMRQNEKQDITYHFISDEEFKQKINEGFFAEYKSYDTEFGTWYYGTALEDLENADSKSIVILTPNGVKDIKGKLHGKDIICIYLYANNTTLKKRLVERKDDTKEANRRLEKDDKDFKGFERYVDRIVYNNYNDDIRNVANKILNFANGVIIK